MELQLVLNTYAKDAFRKQADCDYVAARSNYRLRLREQFLWSSQQAIEKYLKAILLFNGIIARYPSEEGTKKEFRHDLVRLLAAVKKIELFSIDLESGDEEFLAYLSELGINRYLSKSAYNQRDAIQRLDRLVWRVRRYCQYVPGRGLGVEHDVPGMRASFVRMIEHPAHDENPHAFRIMSGHLEKILERPRKDPARQALVWANLWYGRRKRTAVTFRSFSSFEKAPRERIWPGVDKKQIDYYIRP